MSPVWKGITRQIHISAEYMRSWCKQKGCGSCLEQWKKSILKDATEVCEVMLMEAWKRMLGGMRLWLRKITCTWIIVAKVRMKNTI